MTMSIRSLLILAGAVIVTADQHIADSPFLNQYFVDSGYVTISTAGSDATHTTYIAKCDNGGANVCTLPSAGATVVTGPSYVGCSYTDPSEPLFSSVGCTSISAGSSALCTVYQSGQSGTYVATFSHTESLPASAVALGFNTATGTATGSGTKETSEASAGSTAVMTTGAANTGGSGASTTKTSSTHESASKTGSAASETKTGGAVKIAEVPGNVFVAVGAAIMGGLALVI